MNDTEKDNVNIQPMKSHYNGHMTSSLTSHDLSRDQRRIETTEEMALKMSFYF